MMMMMMMRWWWWWWWWWWVYTDNTYIYIYTAHIYKLFSHDMSVVKGTLEYTWKHYSHVISQVRFSLTHKNSEHVICFRYQKYPKVPYLFFAIGLCYACPPKHMSSWHAISSPSEKTPKKYEKHGFALWPFSFTWYSPVCHVITKNGCAPTLHKQHAHTQSNVKMMKVKKPDHVWWYRNRWSRLHSLSLSLLPSPPRGFFWQFSCSMGLNGRSGLQARLQTNTGKT